MTAQRTHIIGLGVTGNRIGAFLDDHTLLPHSGRRPDLGAIDSGDIAVVAHGGPHAGLAISLHERGVHVITVGDALDDCRSLLAAAEHFGRDEATMVIGAAMAPGLSGLIARYLATGLAKVDEIHIATHGTAGPACARNHHRSLSGLSVGLHDGKWEQYVGGSGRELCYFPEPVGPYDCYRARMTAPLMLARSFPDLLRCSVRRSARRRDRFTAWLPMLSPPHAEGGVGGLRVEVRGTNHDGSRACLVAGVAEPVGTSSAATAAAMVSALRSGSLPGGVVGTSDSDLPTLQLLHAVEAHGVRIQEFTGEPS